MRSGPVTPQIFPNVGKVWSCGIKIFLFSFGKRDDRLSGITHHSPRQLPLEEEDARKLHSLPILPKEGQVHFCAQTPRETPSLRLLTRSARETDASLG